MSAHALTIVWVTLTAAACAAAAPAAPKPDADAARQAYRAYVDAMAVGDPAAARAVVVADAKRLQLIDGRPAAAAAERRFRAAMIAAFPDVAAALPTTQSAPATRPGAEAPSVRIERETATIVSRDSIDPIKLRRVDRVWKVDLNAMYAGDVVDDLLQFRRALQDVMLTLATDVSAGRFKTYAAAQAELETRVKMRLATAEEGSTTRPAF